VASVPSASPLFINIATEWENSTITETRGQCSIDAGVAPGTANTAIKSTGDCIPVKIPEIDLYYSNLVFTVGSNSPGTCSQITFQPYYFVRSTVAGFVPGPGVTAVDCSVSPPGTAQAQCFGGTAPNMNETATAFPLSTSIYLLPSVNPYVSYNLKSANTLRMAQTAGTDKQFSNNTLSSNNLSISTTNPGYPAIATANADFVGGAGNYYDYRATCLDPNGNVLYQTSIIIQPTHTTVAGTTQYTYWDWDL
jgi:hypothetical protein